MVAVADKNASLKPYDLKSTGTINGRESRTFECRACNPACHHLLKKGKIKMKITVTYQTTQQTAPYEYSPYTEVVHLEQSDTLETVYEKITSNWPTKNLVQKVNVELHFERENKNS